MWKVVQARMGSFGRSSTQHRCKVRVHQSLSEAGKPSLAHLEGWKQTNGDSGISYLWKQQDKMGLIKPSTDEFKSGDNSPRDLFGPN